MPEKKKLTKEEKNDMLITLGLWVGGAVVAFFLYREFVDPFGDIFGLNTFWKVLITFLALGAAIGSVERGIRRNQYYEKHKRGMKVLSDDPTEKISKLKELKDKGTITKEEYEEKKKELLKKI